MLRRVVDGARRFWTGLNTFVKVGGTVTAAIGIIAAGLQTWSAVDGYFRRHSALGERIAVAERQLGEREYAAAWASNREALALAPDDKEARAQESRIAMAWLQYARTTDRTGTRPLAEMAAPLEAALVQRAGRLDGAQRAEVEAHIAWARFLRGRENAIWPDIDGPLDTALRLDPANTTAHAVRGFWLMWRGRPASEAWPHFDKALEKPSPPAFSDNLILAAHANRITGSDAAGTALGILNYADRIRMRGRPVPGGRATQAIATAYTYALEEPAFLPRLTGLLPADRQVALLGALDRGDLNDGARAVLDVFRAYFLEQSGDKAAARTAYRAVGAADARARAFAEAGLKRVTP